MTLLGEGLGLLGLLRLLGVHPDGVRGSDEIGSMAVGSGLRADLMKTIMKTQKTLQTIAWDRRGRHGDVDRTLETAAFGVAGLSSRPFLPSAPSSSC